MLLGKGRLVEECGYENFQTLPIERHGVSYSAYVFLQIVSFFLLSTNLGVHPVDVSRFFPGTFHSEIIDFVCVVSCILFFLRLLLGIFAYEYVFLDVDHYAERCFGLIYFFEFLPILPLFLLWQSMSRRKIGIVFDLLFFVVLILLFLLSVDRHFLALYCYFYLAILCFAVMDIGLLVSARSWWLKFLCALVLMIGCGFPSF